MKLDLFAFAALLLSFHQVYAWLPTDESRNLSAFSATGTDKIRGVNLGSSFIVEKWMSYGEWNDMGCGQYQSEWGCVQGIGQDAANQAFKKHWQTWITQDDISKMISYGLNTIRVCDLEARRRSTHSKRCLRFLSASGLMRI